LRVNSMWRQGKTEEDDDSFQLEIADETGDVSDVDMSQNEMEIYIDNIRKMIEEKYDEEHSLIFSMKVKGLPNNQIAENLEISIDKVNRRYRSIKGHLAKVIK